MDSATSKRDFIDRGGVDAVVQIAFGEYVIWKYSPAQQSQFGGSGKVVDGCGFS